MSHMNKKYLIVGGAIVFILIILLVVALSSKQTPTQQQTVSKTSTTNQSSTTLYHSGANTNTTIVPTVSQAPSTDPAQAAVEQFYHYYVASPINPLANGAYKNNPYLAPDFKGLIQAAYDNGNTPVFCPQDEQKNIVVGKEVPVNETGVVVMEETISEASAGGKDLYTVSVQNLNNKWLIYDINCL